MIDRSSDSILVERVWRSEGADATQMLSVANSNWELVVARVRGEVLVVIRGPETRTTLVELPEVEATLGIVFAHGTAMPHLPVGRLVDSAVAVEASARRVAMAGEVWELPRFESAEDFVGKLARAGLLRRDRIVSEVAAGADDHGLTARSVQRRVAAATGLTQGAIRQIERARQAATLLQAGVDALDVVHRVGYYDQPHMARSLTRFIGRTATQLQRQTTDVPLSLLYKTPAWGSS
ncbi:helix-turn-helix domain-containing protein [Conexibacter arvalis]|uniref:AraC family transcriptional regulator n=1 Tax=Conexibacter arvalis TaxID=912552 RepID=UPI0031B5D7B4